MELLTLESMGQTSRMSCMTCGKTISTHPNERAALNAGEAIKPRQCRECKPRAKKPEPRKPGHPYRFYTCITCGEQRGRDTATVRTLDPNGPPPPPQECKYCYQKREAHGTTRQYYRGCRCEACRVAISKYNAEHKAPGYKRPHPKLGSGAGYEIRCKNPACLRMFCTSDKRKVCCSNECNFAVLRQRFASAIAPVIYDAEFAEVQQLRLDAGLHEPPVRRGKWISDRRRYAIYERDSYICKICHEECSASYSVDDLLSPTLDHALPWSKAETWQHRDDDFNLRTAHWSCNSSRQDTWSSAEWLSFMVITEDVSVEDARRLRATL